MAYRNRGPAQARMNRKLAKLLDTASRRARDVAELIADEANARAPVDDRVGEDTVGGHLKGSYRAVRDPAEPGSWLVVTDRRYWVFVEFGTREHGDAQPHIRPAIDYARGVFG